MRLTHFGHACVAVQDEGSSGLILIDPGSLAGDLSAVVDVAAVLVTHAHIDHLDLTKLADLRERSPGLGLFVDQGTRAGLPADEKERAVSLDAATSQHVDVAGISVEVVSTFHEVIYPDLPAVPNNGYFLGGQVLHPGDSFLVPDFPVDVLLLPIGAPWLKLAEAIDYLRAVAPRLAIPVHQGGLTHAHRRLHCDLLRKFAPAQSELRELVEGVPVDLSA